MSEQVFNAGRDTIVQLGIGATWGTKVAATVKFPVLNVGLEQKENYKEAESLVGNVFPQVVDIMSEHTEGDIETLLTPDEVCYLLFLHLGVEYKVIPGPVVGYKHYFVPVKSGGALNLPMFSAEVDKLLEVLTYDSLKVTNFSLAAAKEDYIKFTISNVGKAESDGGALTAGLSLSKKSYFKFRRSAIYGSILDSDYLVSGTETGIAAETCAVVPATLTGGAGFEINVPVVDKYGVRSVYRFVGTPISRSATTLTFADAPAGVTDDEINSVTTAAGIIDTANWNLITEEYGDVDGFDFSYDNNLPADKFTSKMKGKLAEINPQGRSATLGVSSYLSDTTNYMRKERYKKGRSLSISLEFEVLDIISGSTVYEFAILFEKLYLTEAPLNIDSPDEIKMDLNFMVAEPIDDYAANDDGTAADTITTSGATDVLRNGHYVRALDVDGYYRTYKYLGTDVTGAANTITFIDAAPAGAEVDSIWLASDIFNDTYWQMAEGVVAYAVDNKNDEWCQART